jgi:hypothetical protein
VHCHRNLVTLAVEELRDIVAKIEHGKRECAGFLIYLRCRDIPVDQLPVGYRSLGGDPIPPPLATPPELKLSPHPEHGALPEYLKDRNVTAASGPHRGFVQNCADPPSSPAVS